MLEERELLYEQVLEEKGSFKRVRRWWRGWHPDLGKLISGWQGEETVQETTVIRPRIIIEVRDGETKDGCLAEEESRVKKVDEATVIC